MSRTLDTLPVYPRYIPIYIYTLLDFLMSVHLLPILHIAHHQPKPTVYLHTSVAPQPRRTAQPTQRHPSMRAVPTLLTGAASLISFSSFAIAVAIPGTTNIMSTPENNLSTTASSGYKNVAYFVNWVAICLVIACKALTNTRNTGYLRPQL